METVFLSSATQGLEAYRDAVYKAIEGLDGYHCLRMEDFGSRDTGSDEFCRAVVADCSIFVGILGHQYGTIHAASGKSYTEREFEAAVQSGKRLLMFLAPEDFPVQAHFREEEGKWQRQRAFRERVKNERQVAFFSSEDDLGRKVLQAIHNCEATLERQVNRSEPSDSGVTWLLFPYVRSFHGWDTGLVISNISLDPIGTAPQAGGVRLYFYGLNAPDPQVVTVIAAGTVFTTTCSIIAPNFTGYVIAQCYFHPARGIAFTMRGDGVDSAPYMAEILQVEPHPEA
jgi:hypothetical protein